MKTVIFWIVSASVYVITIVFLSLKLRDAVKNPEKYEDRELVKQGDELIASKKHYFPFKSLSHQYATVGLLFTFALTAIDFGLISLLQNAAFIKGEKITLGSGSIGILMLFFLNTIVGTCVIPLAIKKPFFEVATRESFSVNSRSETYKKTYILTLVLAVLVLPFAALGANTYAYYDDSGVTYSKFWELGETSVAYEDIAEVKAYIHHDNSGRVNVFCYVLVLQNGREINVNNPNLGTVGFVENTYNIHKLLERKGNCKIELTPLNDVDERYIEGKLSSKQREIVKYIYEGFHRNE